MIHTVDPGRRSQERGTSGKMIITYHEVVKEESRYLYSVSCSEFERHLSLVKKIANENLMGSRYPVVTFDDGHRSNYDLALPLLQKKDINAVFFVTTDWIGKREGFMSWSQLRQLHSLGYGIAAHGASHKLLTHCSPAELVDEVRRSKQSIEDALGIAVTSISVPGGRWNSRVLGTCRDVGYQRLYHSDASERTRNISGIETHGRLMIHRGTTELALRPYLVEDTRYLFILRCKNMVKDACRGLLGDTFYAQAWRALAAKDEANYE